MKQIKQNKIGGFWIRLASRLIDTLVLLTISMFLAWLFLEKKVSDHDIKWTFKQNYLFYIYAVIIIMLILFLFVVCPIICKGKTIGHFVTRTKIVAPNNLINGIIKREVFWSFSWVFCAILTTIIINHTLFFKFIANSGHQNEVFSIWETIRISFVSSIASIIVFMQMLLAISIIVRPNKLGLQDIYSNTQVVYLNKFVHLDLKKNDENELLKPQKVKEITVNFIK